MKSQRYVSRLVVVGLLVVAATGLSAAPASAATGTPTSLTSSQNPSSACGNVTFKATVFGLLFPASPEGAVQFLDGGSLLGATQIITPDFDKFLGAKVVPTNHSSVTITRPLSGGTHVISFGYLGTYPPASGGPLTQIVTAATSATVVSSSVNPTVFGQPTDLTAAVTSACGGSVSGSVQFTVDGSAFGPSRLIDNSGHATLTAADLPVGNHLVTALFTSLGSDLLGSTGTLASGQTVNPADTSTSVVSSANPSEYGAGVTFTATATATSPGDGTPSGGAQFTDNGASLGSLPLDGGGRAAVSTSGLSVGTHTIGAAYGGSSNYHPSSGSLAQLVNRARTALTYDGATSADYNDPAVLSATLTRQDSSAPVPGKLLTLTMAAETCSATTDNGGHASCTIIPSQAAGPATVTARFAGDANYLDAAQDTPFLVTREETTTTYTGPNVIAQNNPVTLSGRLLEDGSTPIVGRALTLTLGTGASSQACTTAPTDGSGNGQCTLAGVTVGQGPQPVRAEFAGDGYYLPSSDTSHQVIVFAFPTRGIFLLGDGSAPLAGPPVTFWSPQWSTLNSLSSGAAPNAFKGFASTTSSTPPSCGSSWSTRPGNSSGPVETVPSYMGTAVTTSVTQSGATISGPITHIVVVLTAPGYGPHPGASGTGTVVATYC